MMLLIAQAAVLLLVKWREEDLAVPSGTRTTKEVAEMGSSILHRRGQEDDTPFPRDIKWMFLSVQSQKRTFSQNEMKKEVLQKLCLLPHLHCHLKEYSTNAIHCIGLPWIVAVIKQ